MLKRERENVERNPPFLRGPSLDKHMISLKKPGRPEDSRMEVTVLRQKACQPIIPYPVTLSFKNEGEIKAFPN